MREFVTISITSFRAGMGGEHWYGTLEVHTKDEKRVNADGSVSWISRGGYGVVPHPHDRTNLERPLSAKEAAYLNKKDQGGMIFRPSFSLKRGDMTTRFNDVASIEAEAARVFPTLFDDTDLLGVETEPYSDHFRFLCGPEELIAALNAAATDREQRELMIAAGYLRKEAPDDGE